MFQDRKALLLRALDPAFVLGMIGTAAFYGVVHQPSMRDSALFRYTTEHVVEYVIVTLFIWSIMDVVLKVLTFPRERLALRQDWLPTRQGREPITSANVLLDRVRAQPKWLQDSKIGRRLVLALQFVTEKGSADEYREHLQYLADQEEDSTHASYSLVRFVVGVTPVLGFLGTVVHFGTALSGISFDELVDKLPAVVSEMGAAFNTTTVALAASMSMMFSLFVCERVERGILQTIDRLVERELLNRFEIKDPNILPFLSVVQSANQEALNAIGGTLKAQVEIWAQSLDALFQRFDQRQQHELLVWQETLDVLQQRFETYDAGHESRFQQSISLVDTKQTQHLAHIQTMLERALAFKQDFAGLAQTLNTIARGEGSLIEMQGVLSTNLRVLRETQQIDEALHGLTAAIHLITARHRVEGTCESAAA